MTEPASRRALMWITYPGTMAAAFLVNAALLATGLSVTVSAYAAILLGATAVTVWEIVIPYERSWRPSGSDIRNDLVFMVTVQMLLPQLLLLFVGVTLVRYLETLDISITQLWPRSLPLALQVGIMLLAAELLRYWMHVAAHNTAILWRLHAIHHSPSKLYWLNVGRFHPVEKALQFLLDSLPFILLGVGADVLALYLIFYAVNGFFQHSNIDARYGILNYVISSSELHHWHHSKLIHESNRNYGNNLIVWDLVFGTWFLPRHRRVGDLGLLNPDYPMTFLGQMTAPLTPHLDKKGAPAHVD